MPLNNSHNLVLVYNSIYYLEPFLNLDIKVVLLAFVFPPILIQLLLILIVQLIRFH